MKKATSSAMHLVQILLPLRFNQGARIAQREFQKVTEELKDGFGGVTIYNRSPAKGLWKDSDMVFDDDVVIYEVMVATLEHEWWSAYREKLEQRFKQQEVVIRATAVIKL